jgi:hypothetical protein
VDRAFDSLDRLITTKSSTFKEIDKDLYFKRDESFEKGLVRLKESIILLESLHVFHEASSVLSDEAGRT